MLFRSLIKAALNLRVGVGFDVYDQTEVYWVHFTGSDVTNILRSYGLTDDKKVFYCGSGPSYQNLFRAMINELLLHELPEPVYLRKFYRLPGHLYLPRSATEILQSGKPVFSA